MATLDQIEVRTYGASGPVVVLLHGGPGAPGSVASLARELADGFRVLEPLQRRSGTVPLTVAQHVADLATVAPTPAVIVGWSWGAMLGLSFAARHPDRVRALALIGCGTYDEVGRAEYGRRMDERLGPAGRRRMRDLLRRLERETDPGRRDRLLTTVGRLARAAQSVELVADEEALPVDARGHDETWQDVLRLQREGIEPVAFARIRAPVLMLHGDQDPHPGPSTRDLLRRFIPQLEYLGFDACGHEPWNERFARIRFLDVFRRWLVAHATRP